MKISLLNNPSDRFADGYEYPPHWSTARIKHYKKFISKNPHLKFGDNYDLWYGKLVKWMEDAGFYH